MENTLSPISRSLGNLELKIVKSRRTEYGDQLNLFLEKLNPGRVETGRSPLTHARLARTLKRGKIPPSFLYAFYQECNNARNFASYFWWRVKNPK